MKTIHLTIYILLTGISILCLNYAIKERQEVFKYQSLEQELHNSFESYLRTSQGKINPKYTCKVKNATN